MAEGKRIYTIQINGLEESYNGVKTLRESLDTLNDTVVKVNQEEQKTVAVKKETAAGTVQALVTGTISGGDASIVLTEGTTTENVINGIITIDTYKDFAIQFEDLTSTENHCDDMSAETAMLLALERAEYCKRINDNEVALLDGQGHIVIRLLRTTLTRQ